MQMLIKSNKVALYIACSPTQYQYEGADIEVLMQT